MIDGDTHKPQGQAVRSAVIARVLIVSCLLALLVFLIVAPRWRQGNTEPEVPQPSSAVHEPAPIDSTEDDSGPSGQGHSDPFTSVLLGLGIVIVAALGSHWLATETRQPPVLGELLVGVALGNLGCWLGEPVSILIMHMDRAGPMLAQVWETGASVQEAARMQFSPGELIPGGFGDRIVESATGPGAPAFLIAAIGLWLFSTLGVVLLLFMVGLKLSVHEMLTVGPRALAVGLTGVIVPLLLGYGAGLLLLPESGPPTHLFLGATLCATSVGITARVLRDMNAIESRSARVILGAAVVDDVIGLVILAVVVGIVSTGGVHLSEVARIVLLSVLFLGFVLLFGERMVRINATFFRKLDRQEYRLLYPLALAFLLAWFASLLELATIIGAFAAGLVIRKEYFEDEEGCETLEHLIAPLERLFAPVFFVIVGMQVNLRVFADIEAMTLAAAFTVAAVIGKLVAGLAADRQAGRWAVGIGMVPRGEVGIIFATVGRSLGVVSDAVFAALLIMVVVTTLITPTALRWCLRHREAGA